jgi:uncharacterized protein with FMN-binding domain
MRRIILVLLSVAAALCLLAACGNAEQTSRAPSASRHSSEAKAAHRSMSSPSPFISGHHVALGKVVQTDYGPVQVRVTTVDGRIIDVTAVRLPDAAPMDRQLSGPAAATLRRLVLAAQSADVDSVSGATYTSTGYLRSLESALQRVRR